MILSTHIHPSIEAPQRSLGKIRRHIDKHSKTNSEEILPLLPHDTNTLAALTPEPTALVVQWLYKQQPQDSSLALLPSHQPAKVMCVSATHNETREVLKAISYPASRRRSYADAHPRGIQLHRHLDEIRSPPPAHKIAISATHALPLDPDRTKSPVPNHLLSGKPTAHRISIGETSLLDRTHMRCAAHM
ncbi:hypothetical protein BU26DRAFT_125442 [Trematosphaeria pertusa]|uniref:Uncharacterized protein n=1 Tax=Trematosphaeria pertusa TaxID=390896 RepID=A0A6A6HZI7_9PLEO|nr:uncharacterized protein BU26DRAFT_125442 [Trematosphaeria pertusa]KAF2243043.1 hypothetical protein BU26DRAFT_125442 [Trematosphaeria pertusa]